ncbi:hypothetical protein [Candidatus Contubernalis alkaliaceticus]|uniref:hypothetical protein n=1 Tax=Candidatus Contubernalis alkaliaceticus TaxID=338645 RepID=UPI001F4C461A|nr:hypothetical protein [Candidatus Contubernalis alkalaceticus]UNC90607.1 hypothetical protein HUE98_08630 [Candidatus Contubernalis alkalaceticus]
MAAATGTGSGCTPLIEFFDLLSVHNGFVTQVSDEFLDRVVILNLTVDALVNNNDARSSKGLPFVPVTYLKVCIRVVF